MTKRTLAALCALLAFMAVLVAVPLATSETAEAHELYKTVRRCVVDPPINHCWDEKVRQWHYHAPKVDPPTEEDLWGTTTTTTPPTTTTTTTEPPKCPAGMSGTPPNCVKDVCPSGTSGTPPNCVKEVCPTGWTGTPPDCRIIVTVCPSGYSGTPPNCVKDQPKVCPSGYSGTPPNCTLLPCIDGSHRHARNSASGTSCHLASVSHCPDGEHEHVHGSGQCHVYVSSRLVSSVRSNRHAGYSQHCAAAGHHEHEHGSGDCHHADTIHCPAGQHAHPEVVNGATLHERCHAEKPTDHHCGGDSGHNTGRHKHDGLGCHPAGADNCPTGQHEHTGGAFLNIHGCHATGTVHQDYFTKGHEHVLSGTGTVVCFFVGGAAGKAVKLVNKGPKWLKNLLGDNVDTGTNVGCDTLFDKAIEAEKKRAAEDKKEHEEDAQDKDDDDGTTEGDGDGTTEGDGPSLEGSWDDVLRRNAPKDADAEQELYERYMCGLGITWFCG